MPSVTCFMPSILTGLGIVELPEPLIHILPAKRNIATNYLTLLGS